MSPTKAFYGESGGCNVPAWRSRSGDGFVARWNTDEIYRGRRKWWSLRRGCTEWNKDWVRNLHMFPIYSTLKIHKNQLHFSLLLWFFFMIQSMNEDWWKGFKKILNICIDLISENHLNLKRKKAWIVKEFSTCYWMNFEIFTFRILLIFRIFHISYHMQ